MGWDSWGGRLGVGDLEWGSWDRGLEAGILGRGSVGWLVSQSLGWGRRLGVRVLGWGSWGESWLVGQSVSEPWESWVERAESNRFEFL